MSSRTIPTSPLTRTDRLPDAAPAVSAAGAEPSYSVRIDSLGSEGDGVSRERGAPLHVAYALGGETVMVHPVGRGRAIAGQVLEASPDRVTPPCRLFGRCGGCVLQHLDRAAALAWKTGLVRDALRNAGFTPPAEILAVQSPPSTRRRMDLAVRRGPEGVIIGLHARGSDEVVALTECHVLLPRLFELIAPLQLVLTRLQGLRKSGSASVNMLESGPDILLSTDAEMVPRDRTILAEFAAAQGVPRIAWQLAGGRAVVETLCSLAPSIHSFGGVTITPPAGTFMQATLEGERAITDAVLAALPDRLPRSARIVELYAGCGTISFPLATRARVIAYEGDQASVACVRAAGSGHRVEITQRDLNRQPVMARDFAGAAAIVLDPPHAGAGAQARELAGSNVGTVIYVSCNPTALAQDARLLAEAGYRLDRVTVIDQFLWSARAESVCLFTRTIPTVRGPLRRPAR